MNANAVLTQSERLALLGGSMLSYDDIAGYLGIGLRTCKRWVSDGTLPRPDLRLHGVVRWHSTTIRRWVEKQNRQKTERDI